MHQTEGGSADTISGVAPRSGSRITIPLAVPTHSRILGTPRWRFPAPPLRVSVADSELREIAPIVSRGPGRGYTAQDLLDFVIAAGQRNVTGEADRIDDRDQIEDGRKRSGGLQNKPGGRHPDNSRQRREGVRQPHQDSRVA